MRDRSAALGSKEEDQWSLEAKIEEKGGVQSVFCRGKKKKRERAERLRLREIGFRFSEVRGPE